MKRLLNCFIVILSLFFLVSCSDNSSTFPKSSPTTTLTINDTSYECVLGNGNWFDSSKDGNSRMGDPYEQFNDSCSFIEIAAGDELSFDISYKENFQVVNLNLVTFNTDQSPVYTKLSTDEYSFKAPTEKGEYNYTFRVTWDDTHSLDYLFKLKVV